MADERVEFRLGYRWDGSIRRALVGAYADVFAIDVARFDALNAWDSQAELFSGFAGGRMVTNVMLLPVAMVCDHRPVRAAAGALGFTAPDYRGRGHYGRVFEALAAYAAEHFDLLFFFTDKSDLYARRGFRVVYDDWFELPASSVSQPAAVRALDDRSAEDLALLRRLLRERTSVSNVLGFRAGESIFLYNELPRGLRRVRYSDALDTAIVYELDGDTLRLLDVICRDMPSYEAILSMVSASYKRVICCFTPDRLKVPGVVRPRAHEDVLMVRGGFPIEDRAFAFPPTAYC